MRDTELPLNKKIDSRNKSRVEQKSESNNRCRSVPSTHSVTMASRRALLFAVLALSIALLATPSHAFYLPGVAPQDFAPVR